MFRILNRMQKRNGHGRKPSLKQCIRELIKRFIIEWFQHITVRIHSLIKFKNKIVQGISLIDIKRKQIAICLRLISIKLIPCTILFLNLMSEWMRTVMC